MAGIVPSRKRQLIILSALIATSPIATAAAAQGSGPNAVSSDESAEAPEIMVTALRRETTLLQTPAAVTAIGGDALREQQVTSLTDLSASVPSLSIGEAAGVSLVTVRGISLDAIIGGIEGSVAIHRDGVYLSQAIPLNFLLMDVGGVEVLRGPQGTLYGRNATGGTINVTPARATRDFTGYLNLSFGNLGTFREEAAVSGPLAGDTLLFRLAAMGEQRTNGYGRNLKTDEKLGTSYEKGVRGSLEFHPSPDFSARLEGYYFHGRNTSDFWANLEPFSASQLAANPDFSNYAVSYDPRKVELDFTPEDVQTSQGGLLALNWDFASNLSLQSTTSYTDLAYERRHADCDGTAIPTCSSNRSDRSKSFQQEVDLKLKSDRLNGLIGMFYDNDLANARQTFPWNNAAQGFVSVSGFPLPNGTQTMQISRQRTESIAVFTDADLKLAPWINLYGGARYSEDKRKMTLTSGLGLTFNDAILLGCTDFAKDLKFTDFSGKAGIQLHHDERNQIYAQWQQGFKAGGFNAASCGATFEPENITAFEIGYKGRLLDNRLEIAAAAFSYDYTNLQTAQIVGVSYSITNAASAKIEGLELEATFRSTSRFQIDGHVTLLDARYGDYTNFDPINLAAGAQDLRDKRLNRAPTFSGSLGAQYTVPLGAGELKLRGELTHTSSYYFRPFNEALDRQDGFTSGNAFASYKLPNGLELRAFVRNIADKTIIAGIFTSDIGQTRQAQYQPPRTYGVGLNYSF